jgi:hypothetical protein
MTAPQLAALIAAGVIGLTVIGLLIRLIVINQRALAAHQLRMANLELTAMIFRGPIRGDH